MIKIMPKTILIVDDDESLRDLFTIELEAHGFNVLQAKDGVEGLSQALSKKPDLIVLDMIMPNMDGMAMLRSLREDEWGKNAKVIILSNVGDGSKLSEAVEAGLIESGINDYLLKIDCQPNELANQIKERLGMS
jgi:DNA-binding response OmpR family regulator